MVINILVGLAGLCLGLVLGSWIEYLKGRPIQRALFHQVERIYLMKKQGFIPQFTFEQKVENDPASDITEY